MTAKTSVERIRFRRKPGRLIRWVIAVLSVFSLLLLVLAVLTFTTADRVMRQEPVPLQTPNSNVMPAFSVISFPSLDEQTMLQGWYLTTKEDPVSTIILVHDQGQNRLLFGAETPLLYNHLVDLGFNVLSFDLRNTGQSDGHLSGFGYAEWADVIAAIRYARQNAPTTDVLLYGFGTGASAVLMAWDQLPAKGADPDLLPEQIKKLDFDRSYVIGLLLDAPAATPDLAVQALLEKEKGFARHVLKYTVPYAVRLSSGYGKTFNPNTVLGACPIPVLLVHYKNDPFIGRDVSDVIVSQREQLHPHLTQAISIGTEGHADGFLTERESYLEGLDRFLARFF